MELAHVESSTTSYYVELLRNGRKHQHVAGTESEVCLLGLKGDAAFFIFPVNIHEVSDQHNLMVLLGPCLSKNPHLSQLERSQREHPCDTNEERLNHEKFWALMFC